MKLQSCYDAAGGKSYDVSQESRPNSDQYHFCGFSMAGRRAKKNHHNNLIVPDAPFRAYCSAEKMLLHQAIVVPRRISASKF
tara:strand:+ start:1005 stop:1250 length:246 start_codon:yes stop_codon:yes gene_type:complete